VGIAANRRVDLKSAEKRIVKETLNKLEGKKVCPNMSREKEVEKFGSWNQGLGGILGKMDLY